MKNYVNALLFSILHFTNFAESGMSLKDLYFLISDFWFDAEGVDGAVKEFNTGLGTCKMIYVKNGNEEYRKILSDMFKTPDAYDR